MTTDPEGWIAWEGGKCPVPAGTKVEVWMRLDSDAPGLADRADMLRWSHWQGVNGALGLGDIVAYRVVK